MSSVRGCTALVLLQLVLFIGCSRTNNERAEDIPADDAQSDKGGEQTSPPKEPDGTQPPPPPNGAEGPPEPIIVHPKNRTVEGVTAIVVILVASFLIDRLVTGLLHVLSYIPYWARIFEDPAKIEDDEEEDEEEREIVLPSGESAEQHEISRKPARVRRVEAEDRLKLAYYSFASLLAIGVIAGLGQVRMFDAVGFHEIHPWIDRILTGLIIVAGADRLADLLNLPNSPAAKRTQRRPIQISGELTLKEPRKS